MKLQPDKPGGRVISGHGAGWVGIDGVSHRHSVIVSAQGSVLPWACDRFDALDASHFEPIALLDAEVVLFGSGRRLRFPRPEWIIALTRRQLGLETMDTAAACRTYNILAGEGRRVVAALLVEPPAGGGGAGHESR